MMKRAITMLAILGYVAGFSLTYGVAVHDDEAACDAARARDPADSYLPECYDVGGPVWVIASLFWPLSWTARLGIELTK